MPRLKVDIEKNIRLSIISAWAVRNGYKGVEIARVWGCAESTVSDLRKRPERLTIEKIERMKLDKDELYTLIYGSRNEH